MSAVYTIGTINVTNGSDIVTGTGTGWVGVLQTGWQIKLPDGEIYWVRQVNSDTQLQLEDDYTGTSQSGQDYIAGPTGGIARALANKVQDLIGDFQGVVDNAGAGRFADGTPAQPGIRFVDDEDTGLHRPASNEIAVITGGVESGRFTAAGFTGLADSSITGSKLAQTNIITAPDQLSDFVVTGPKIADSAVDTDNIANQAVSNVQLVAGQATQTIDRTDTTSTVIATLTVNQSGGAAQLIGHFNIAALTGGVIEFDKLLNFNVYIKRNGDIHSGISGLNVFGATTPSIVISTSSTFTGSVTYTLEYESTGAGNADQAFISAPRLQFMEMKR